MPRKIIIRAALLATAAASLPACAQTPNVDRAADRMPAGEIAAGSEQSAPQSSGETPPKNNNAQSNIAKDNTAKNNSAKNSNASQKGAALPPPDLSEGRYWVKNGLTGLYDENGNWLRLLQNAGPHRIYARTGGLAKISVDENHWVKFESLSPNKPAMRPQTKTTPNRPVTRFPNALEDEIKRRGLETETKPEKT